MVDAWSSGDVGSHAQQGLPDSALRPLFDGPAALWCLGRNRGELRWANRPARALFGMSDAAQAWPDWWAGASARPAAVPQEWLPWAELARASVAAEPGHAERHLPWPRLVQGHPQLWQLTAQVQAEVVLLMAVPVGTAAAEAAAPWNAHPQHRDLLVREVHHRLKNNLQGVSGLLRQQALLHPPAAQWLEEAAGQLQAMAQVYGLQTAGVAAPRLSDLVRAVAGGVQSVFGVPVLVEAEDERAEGPGPGQGQGPQNADASPVPPSPSALRQTLWAHLPEPPSLQADPGMPAHVHPDQAGALALVLNELMTNAVKHARPSVDPAQEHGQVQVTCRLRRRGELREVDILNPGQWPAHLSLTSLPPSVQGLGLVKALLPSRGARLEVLTEPGRVCARLHIGPPLLCSADQTP